MSSKIHLAFCNNQFVSLRNCTVCASENTHLEFPRQVHDDRWEWRTFQVFEHHLALEQVFIKISWFILAVEYIPPFVWWLCKLLTMHHVQACMDREKQDEVASLQLAWIDGICLPLYKVGISRKHVNYSFLTSFSTSPVPSVHSFPLTHNFAECVI